MEIVKGYMLEFKGILGIIMAISFPFVDYFGVGIQILGGLGGLFLLALSIQHKQLQKKKEQLEIKKLEEE